MNTQDREEFLTLEILETIEQKDDVTQRHLADRLGVALGLTNSYLKRCVRKGWVKIQQVPANRYLYYLTPKGFSEKSRLTAKYLSVSFDFYRNASKAFDVIYTECEKKNHRKILLCGVSELAEIATIRSQDHNVRIIGIYDPATKKDKFLNLQVWHEFSGIKDFDVCVLTALNNPLEFYENLLTDFERELIFIPTILGINKDKQIT